MFTLRQFQIAVIIVNLISICMTQYVIWENNIYLSTIRCHVGMVLNPGDMCDMRFVAPVRGELFEIPDNKHGLWFHPSDAQPM